MLYFICGYFRFEAIAKIFLSNFGYGLECLLSKLFSLILVMTTLYHEREVYVFVGDDSIVTNRGYIFIFISSC